MATKVDDGVIFAQADRHEGFIEDVEAKLKQLMTEVDALLVGSESGVTKAVKQSAESWAESVKNKAMAQIREMATTMRKEATDQVDLDETQMQSIMNMGIGTGTSDFLTGK